MIRCAQDTLSAASLRVYRARSAECMARVGPEHRRDAWAATSQHEWLGAVVEMIRLFR